MIDTNLRTIKMTDTSTGYYCKSGICKHCGHNELCSMQGVVRQKCDVYQPVLAFQSLAGCELSFNTFRLGHAWGKRVLPGRIVGLIDKNGHRIAEAVVEAVRIGPRGEMFQEHAAANHLMIAARPANPVAELTRKVRNLYGPNFLARAEQMSVIYLRLIE